MAVIAKFAAVLLLVACASAQSLDVVPVNNCKGLMLSSNIGETMNMNLNRNLILNDQIGSGQLLEVRISNCGSVPCIFKKGEFTTIEMDFIPSNFLLYTYILTPKVGR